MASHKKDARGPIADEDRDGGTAMTILTVIGAFKSRTPALPKNGLVIGYSLLLGIPRTPPDGDDDSVVNSTCADKPERGRRSKRKTGRTGAVGGRRLSQQRCRQGNNVGSQRLC